MKNSIIIIVVVACAVAGALFFGIAGSNHVATSNVAHQPPEDVKTASTTISNPRIRGNSNDVTLAVKALNVPQKGIQMKLPQQPELNAPLQPATTVVLPDLTQKEAPPSVKVTRQTPEARQAVRAQEMMLYKKQFPMPAHGSDVLRLPPKLPASPKQ